MTVTVPASRWFRCAALGLAALLAALAGPVRALEPGRALAALAERERIGRELSASLQQEWFSVGVAMGYRYEESPIVVSDGNIDAGPARDRFRTGRGIHV